jgi:hypothetical protein
VASILFAECEGTEGGLLELHVAVNHLGEASRTPAGIIANSQPIAHASLRYDELP